MTLTISRTDAQRDVTIVCPHGATHLADDLPSAWTDADHTEQAVTYHQLDFPACHCFDQDEAAADADDALEHVRPKIFPPLPMQWAALRLMAAARAEELDVRDPGLRQDARLLQWFRQHRDRSR